MGIKINDISDDIKIPFISKDLLEYLETQFGMDFLIGYKASNNDEHMGYIKGVRDTIATLRYHYETQNEREV